MREALGSEVLVHFTVAARQAVTDEMRELAEDVGDDRVARPTRIRCATAGSARSSVASAHSLASSKATSSRSRSSDGRSISSI